MSQSEIQRERRAVLHVNLVTLFSHIGHKNVDVSLAPICLAKASQQDNSRQCLCDASQRHAYDKQNSLKTESALSTAWGLIRISSFVSIRPVLMVAS
ncbi:hypothetical protein PoB_005540600 [Plakobranchus ocellatus]|uniref:BHLH domain-containing protein n=1 Tax=Plakobranchus ocellatus TaxID=259542 RepID=A0AAV4C0K7_9GAST|nr:hypothetical protein PoB_005540600 [Plakobranchus ocellatus]